MSNEVTNNLSKEKLQQILASIGSQKADDSNKIEAVEYDWRQPHYFNSNQLKKLDDFTQKMAAAITEKFDALYHSEFDVKTISTTQHFADELLNQTSDNKQDNYYLAFGTDHNKPCGFISIPSRTAIVWTKQLLGDSESKEDSDKGLSKLEESLLLDIASALIKALSAPYDDYDFHPAENIVKNQLPFELQNTQELCKITFNIKEAKSENNSEVYFLIHCSELEPVIGESAQAGYEFSAEDISKVMLKHVQEMPAFVTAQLASIVLTFEEVTSLGVDDILLFDKEINEPIELIVEGKTVLRGRPAKSAGKHAVVITEPACNTV